jgi:arginyl-tRNA synthetase
MALAEEIRMAVLNSLKKLYSQDFSEKDFQINQTKPEFKGDYTVVLFSLVKLLKKSPDAIGNEIGEFLVANNKNLVAEFNLIKGFLNLSIGDAYWFEFVQQNYQGGHFGLQPEG